MAIATIAVTFIGACPLLPPKIPKLRRAQLRVAHRRGDRPMPHVVLQRSRVVAVIGELKATGLSM
jgi:hypothetical protein